MHNYHSHTQFCDGHAPMAEIAMAACREGFAVWGISPHSPIPLESPCNMSRDDVPVFIAETERLKRLYTGRMQVLAGMEIDYLSPEWGPAVTYFKELPLDYRIGSVHFVPNREGEYIDCDGSAARFAKNLRERFGSDLRYVVDTYFNQVCQMIRLGGFDILGHLDKIAANAASVDPTIEDRPWYEEHIRRVISLAAEKGLTVEINTKSARTDPEREPADADEAQASGGRFFPARRWWPLLREAGLKIVINSDAHWPERTNPGLTEELEKTFADAKKNL